MTVQKLILVILICCVCASDVNITCNSKEALKFIKQSTFDFSIRLLQRVAEDTDAHFVYSPLTTWLQLTALSEGANGDTLMQIWNITKKRRDKCFRKNVHRIIYELNVALKMGTHRKGNSVMAIDEALAVKRKFINVVQNLYGISVFTLDFDKPLRAADMINKAFAEGTGGIIDTILYYDDFGPAKLILGDAYSFHSIWQTKFYYRTELRPFYSSFGKVIGAVNMMQHTGYYSLVTLQLLGAKVLEIPLNIPGVSMLLFLTTFKTWVGELFHGLGKIKLAALLKFLNREEQKLVNIHLPKFDIITEVENLDELISDMGISRIFAENAELKGISDYIMHTSLMTQISRLRVSEKGLSQAIAIRALNESGIDYIANRPFIYTVVDKNNELILYAGAYSIPSEI